MKLKLVITTLSLISIAITACGKNEANHKYSQSFQEKTSTDCADKFFKGISPTYSFKDDVQTLCNKGYAVLYSNDKYVPIFSAEKITVESFQDSVDRTEDFRADDRVKNSSQPTWYSHSGYDRGHMVPAQDLSANTELMSSSFLMTNMVPQTPDLNRKTWMFLESHIRKNVKKYNETAYVISGPVFENQQPLKKLHEVVWVPSYTFKVIHYVNANRTEAYMVPNGEKLGAFYQYQVNIKDVEQKTGLTFN